MELEDVLVTEDKKIFGAIYKDKRGYYLTAYVYVNYEGEKRKQVIRYEVSLPNRLVKLYNSFADYAHKWFAEANLSYPLWES